MEFFWLQIRIQRSKKVKKKLFFFLHYKLYKFVTFKIGYLLNGIYLLYLIIYLIIYTNNNLLLIIYY